MNKSNNLKSVSNISDSDRLHVIVMRIEGQSGMKKQKKPLIFMQEKHLKWSTITLLFILGC